ncbi:MAG: hypothetical protein J6B29_06610 [Clostridia bacterium]|nr:hypothetical protein [Clostridia bacterium]
MSSVTEFQNNLKYKNARGSLLAVVVLSLVNLFAIIFADVYFLFSSYITQIFAFMGWEEYVVTGELTSAIIYIVLGIISVVPYLLCYFLSKKSIGWMIGATVLFTLDTVLFLVDFIPYVIAGNMDGIIDLVFHAYALISLIACVVYGFKAKGTKAQELEPPLTYSDELAQESRTVTISKKKQAYGFAAKSVCYIDDEQVAVLGNGEERTVSVDGNEHILMVVTGNGESSERVKIPAGYGNKSYEITFKSHFVKGAIPVVTEKTYNL